MSPPTPRGTRREQSAASRSLPNDLDSHCPFPGANLIEVSEVDSSELAQHHRTVDDRYRLRAPHNNASQVRICVKRPGRKFVSPGSRLNVFGTWVQVLTL